MSFRTVAAMGLGTLLLVVGVARADLTAFWRHNPITPEALADDPALAGMQSWSLMVTHAEGIFASAGLRVMLPAAFYRNPVGGDTRPSDTAINKHPSLGSV